MTGLSNLRQRLIALNTLVLLLIGSPVMAQTLTKENYDSLVPAGKEIDAIYGDVAIGNDAARAIVAQPLPSRHSNMTVREVRGAIIDFAFTGFPSDQLSAFYPTRRAFPFSKIKQEDDAVIVTAPGTDSRPTCSVKYEMVPGLPALKITSTWINDTSKPWQVKLEDDMRIDGNNEDMVKSPAGEGDSVTVNDVFWQQAYGILAPNLKITSQGDRRMTVIRYELDFGILPLLEPGQAYEFERYLVVHKDLLGVKAVFAELQRKKQTACQFRLTDADGQPIADAQLKVEQGQELVGILRTSPTGQTSGSLAPGTYQISATAAGVALLKPKSEINVTQEAGSFDLRAANYHAGKAALTVVDGQGVALPCKIAFLGEGDTPTPRWGPDSAEYFVRNLAYTASGKVNVPLAAGTYNLIVSRGPEYDAVFTRIEIKPQETSELNVTLKRSVSTPGWISSDFHSHSSPSGDNTGSQLGRVLNLVAEHVEFAPCTEHNRISSYSPLLESLGMTGEMATVSGMELTGSPLPLNHQNVFPLKEVPRTQDGGGPLTDRDPEKQIERVTLWDDRSEKLVQQNHPDIGWLFYDRDGDGSPDRGYWRSFRLMDCMEIHPIDSILTLGPFQIRNGKPNANQPLFNWLQLLNQGHRIYGVVNTDAHYNFHGSGWLRNWIQSSTDDPAKIDTLEMVHASEQGRLIMSNGPYLEATFRTKEQPAGVVSGMDLKAADSKVEVDIRVQCANWLDVDTVLILVNGEVRDEYRFTREQHPDAFSDDVLKFERTIPVSLDGDSHLIVVAGHSRQPLGDVMGPSGGRQLPAALTNPVFVDVDGDGFKPNQDTLGQPLPVNLAHAKTRLQRCARRRDRRRTLGRNTMRNRSQAV